MRYAPCRGFFSSLLEQGALKQHARAWGDAAIARELGEGRALLDAQRAALDPRPMALSEIGEHAADMGARQAQHVGQVLAGEREAAGLPARHAALLEPVEDLEEEIGHALRRIEAAQDAAPDIVAALILDHPAQQAQAPIGMALEQLAEPPAAQHAEAGLGERLHRMLGQAQDMRLEAEKVARQHDVENLAALIVAQRAVADRPAVIEGEQRAADLAGLDHLGARRDGDVRALHLLDELGLAVVERAKERPWPQPTLRAGNRLVHRHPPPENMRASKELGLSDA